MQAREDPLVCLAVRLVGRLEPVLVEVERVGVLHDEFASTQDARARTALVAVLRLDLVQRDRQVLVGGVLALDGESEQFLVGGAEQHVDALAVGEPEQRVAVLGPAVRRLVRLARQQSGQQDLLRADRVHLVADHLLHPPQHPQAERQPRVHAGRDPAHVARAHEQLVAGHLGVGGVVAQGAQEEVGHPRDHRGQG